MRATSHAKTAHAKTAGPGPSISAVFKALAASAREAIEVLYASSAGAILERKENFEDAQAERKARRQAISRKKKGVAAAQPRNAS